MELSVCPNTFIPIILCSIMIECRNLALGHLQITVQQLSDFTLITGRYLRKNPTTAVR